MTSEDTPHAKVRALELLPPGYRWEAVAQEGLDALDARRIVQNDEARDRKQMAEAVKLSAHDALERRAQEFRSGVGANALSLVTEVESQVAPRLPRSCGTCTPDQKWSCDVCKPMLIQAVKAYFLGITTLGGVKIHPGKFFTEELVVDFDKVVDNIFEKTPDGRPKVPKEGELSERLWPLISILEDYVVRNYEEAHK
jgi:hypothetical protein